MSKPASKTLIGAFVVGAVALAVADRGDFSDAQGDRDFLNVMDADVPASRANLTALGLTGSSTDDQVDESDQVVAHVVECVPAGRPRGTTLAAKVHCEHFEVICQ